MSAPQIKVSVCIPCQDTVMTPFAISLVRMVGVTIATYDNIEVQVLWDQGTVISSQRNGLARHALNVGADYCLWLDSDMMFPEDLLVRLLRHRKPIVACNYATRRLPITTVAFRDPTENSPMNRVYTDDYATGLEPVAAIGMGAMLVETDVYRKLPEPWHHFEWDKATNEDNGEDIYFCRAARAAGYEILVDHDTSKLVSHVGIWRFSHEQAVASRPIAEEAWFLEQQQKAQREAYAKEAVTA